jgi:anthranilate/para-aminobenzoate synthase component I
MIKYVLCIPTKYMENANNFLKLTRLPMAIPPFELYQRLCSEGSGSFMLESAVGDQRTVAYSFLGSRPDQVLRCSQGRVEGGEGLDHLREDPVAFLKEFQARNKLACQRFPYIGGLVGYFSYAFAPTANLPSQSSGMRTSPSSSWASTGRASSTTIPISRPTISA